MNPLPLSRIVLRDVRTGATEIFNRACPLSEAEQLCAVYNRLYQDYFYFTAEPTFLRC